MPIFATDIKSLVPRFRLLRGGYEGSELNENQTLEELRISHNDTLVLVAKRNHFQQMMITRETRSPPDIDIDIATRNLTVRTSDVPMVDINEIFQQSNVNIRKNSSIGLLICLNFSAPIRCPKSFNILSSIFSRHHWFRAICETFNCHA